MSVLAGVESFKAAPVGLIVILLLGIAIYFLAKSMARHLRRVPDSFEPDAGTPAAPVGTPGDLAGTGSSGSGSGAGSAGSGAGAASADPPGTG